MGRPPIGKVRMTAAERQRRRRERLRDSAPVTKQTRPADTEAPLLKAKIATLEAEIARLRVNARRAEARVKEPAPKRGGTGIGELNEKAWKIVRKLSDDDDGTVLTAARALARDYDLRALATALEELAAGRREKTAASPPIDYAKVEAAVTRYAEGKTTVAFAALWKAVVAGMPALKRAGPEALGPVVLYIRQYLGRLGFDARAGSNTFRRPA